ncbi:VCBS repeat-containing protein [Micromonospora sp. STR1s_5]|nr:VCBS repeat-containing protein [Micromonospora sp. STR1s_5]
MPQPAAAARMAEDCDRRVEVTSQRTETTQVYVNADGTSTVEQHAYPQRARRADGGWTALDPTLVKAPDGTLMPKASAVAVSFSAGGSSEFVRVRRDGGEVALSWPAVLPKPRVEGTRATYAEVFRGVDLVATALNTGFSFVLVVKDRKAALDPALRRVTLESKLSGLKWKGTRAVNSRGRVVLAAAAPLMWDGSGVGASTLDAPGDGARSAAVKLGVSVGGQLILEPDADLLLNPKVTFPVVVDPTIGITLWTMINGGAKDQEYWAFDRRDCPVGYSTECAKVGYRPEAHAGATHSQYRSMFEFSAAHWQGKQVLDGSLAPRLTMDLVWSSACTPQTTFLHAVRSGGVFSDANWNNTLNTWHVAVSNVSNTSCNGARLPTEFSMAPSALGEHVNGRLVLGLKAQSESDSAQWKKFDATTAKLIVNLNSIPGAPTNVTVDGKECKTGDARPFVPTSTATVRATASDADRDTLSVRVVRQRVRDDGSLGPETLLAQQGVPAGTPALVTMGSGVLDQGDTFVATGDWDKDGKPDVIGRDPNGYLYLFQGGKGGANGRLGPRVQIASGWGHWEWDIAGIADWNKDGFLDVIVRQVSTLQLWVYTGGRTATGFDGQRFLLGSDWGSGYTFAGIADWDRDGNQDVIARDAGGGLWLYLGRGGRDSLAGQRVLLGNGWVGYTYFGVPDWDKDGKADVVARDPESGQLWLYPGNGLRGLLSDGRFEVASGWKGYHALTIPDVNGDGKVDIVALPPDFRVWTVYPGTGGRVGGGAGRWDIAAPGTSNGGTYSFRTYASDGKADGTATGPCEFTVDVERPTQVMVRGDVYKEQTAGGCDGAACGSVGQAGQFTFESPPDSPDVTHYEWGFAESLGSTARPSSLGGPVTVNWAPSSGGTHTLYVVSVDRAGNRSPLRRYEFVVAAPTAPVARWLMNDDSGSTTLADDMGNGRSLSVSGGVTLGASGRLLPGNDGASRSAVRFDGVDDFAFRAKVLDTGRNFSVSAWVKLDAKTGDQVVVAQAGQNSTAFQLRYSAAPNRWEFVTSERDASGVPNRIAPSTSPVQVGAWTHLTGVFISTQGLLRLYVNGVLEGSVGDARSFSSTGSFLIGKSGHGLPYKGSVAEVQVWNREVSAAEVFALADPLEVGQVGTWHFENPGNDWAPDSSGFRRDLNLHGAEILSEAGQNGAGLRLDGVDDHAASDGQILRTDQSFTVSARVKLDAASITRPQTFVSQRSGGTYPGFYLRYAPSNGGEWVFAMQASATDANNGTHAIARVGSTILTDYHHLVGVFDAQRRQLRLYVDQALVATVSMHAAWQPWDATGPLLVGTFGAGTHAKADIDEVRVLQGAVQTATALFQGTNNVATGQRLTAGQDVYANAGNHRLVMQGDGNLVKYSNDVVQWASGTQGNPDAYAVLQSDGNFVVYDSRGTLLWSTQTTGESAKSLTVLNDGRAVLYGPSAQIVWSR